MVFKGHRYTLLVAIYLSDINDVFIKKVGKQ